MTTFDPHRYTITIKLVTLEEGEHFEAVVAELPDLVEYGETYDHAYSLAVESIGSLQEAAREQGRKFPAPLPSRAMTEFSGRVTLRMTPSLHAGASRFAEQEGVSLNSWIVEAIGARVGGGIAASASVRISKIMPSTEKKRAFLSSPAFATYWQFAEQARFFGGDQSGTLFISAIASERIASSNQPTIVEKRSCLQ